MLSVQAGTKSFFLGALSPCSNPFYPPPLFLSILNLDLVVHIPLFTYLNALSEIATPIASKGDQGSSHIAVMA